MLATEKCLFAIAIATNQNLKQRQGPKADGFVSKRSMNHKHDSLPEWSKGVGPSCVCVLLACLLTSMCMCRAQLALSAHGAPQKPCARVWFVCFVLCDGLLVVFACPCVCVCLGVCLCVFVVVRWFAALLCSVLVWVVLVCWLLVWLGG